MVALTTSSNVELNHAMKDIAHYRGCHYKDWCNYHEPDPEEYIIFNLANKGDRGTHWVAVCNKPDSENIEFFDSYGLPIPETILKYMKLSGKRVVGINNEIQAWESKACGWYCVDYLTRRSRGESIYNIIYSFQDGKNQMANDKLLKRSLQNNLPPENNMAAAVVSGISQALPLLGKIAPYIMKGIQWIDTKVKEANARRRVRIAERKERKLRGGGYGDEEEEEEEEAEDEYEDGEGFGDVIKGFLKITKPSTATMLKMASSLTTKYFPEVHDQVMSILAHYAEKRMQETNYGSGLDEDGTYLHGEGVRDVLKKVWNGFQPSHRYVAKTIISLLKKNIDPAIAQDVADILYAALRRKGIDVEGDGFQLVKFKEKMYPSGKGKSLKELKREKPFMELYRTEREKGIDSDYWSTKTYDQSEFQNYLSRRIAAEKHSYLMELKAKSPTKTKLTPLQEARIEEKVEREVHQIYGRYKGRKGNEKLNIPARNADPSIISELRNINSNNSFYPIPQRKPNPWQEFIKANSKNPNLEGLPFKERMSEMKKLYAKHKESQGYHVSSKTPKAKSVPKAKSKAAKTIFDE